MVNSTHFESFKSDALAAGFNEALERHWPADTVLGLHSHVFIAHAVVTQGEMWLTRGDDTLYLTDGSTFQIAAEVLHSERYGAAGATYWVARRNAG